MKSIHDNSFKSKKINNLGKIYGGRGSDGAPGNSGGGITCVLTDKGGHILHDNDKKDPPNGDDGELDL